MKLFISGLNTGDPNAPDTTVPEGIASVQIISDEVFVANEPSQTNRWYGRATTKELSDGTWICIYTNAQSHVDTLWSVCMVKFSDDYGETWTAENFDLDGNAVVGFPQCPPDGCVGDPQGAVEGYVMVMPNGDLINSMWKAKFGQINSGSWHSRSTDNGKTWSTPALVNYLDGPVEMGDNEVFMTDDSFILGSVIYAGARWHTNAPAENKALNVFNKSEDNGLTWKVVSFLNSDPNYSIEYGMEYVGNDTIVAHSRSTGPNGLKPTAMHVSTDMGLTWNTTNPANIQVMGRQRMMTRSHVKMTNNWWLDPVVISHGFEQNGYPSSHPRHWGVWFSKDFGATWGTVQYLRPSGWDGGYGDFQWNPILEHYVTINYYAPTSYYDGYLRIVKWKLIWS